MTQLFPWLELGVHCFVPADPQIQSLVSEEQPGSPIPVTTNMLRFIPCMMLAIAGMALVRPQRAGDPERNAFPVFRLALELTPAGIGQCVKLCAPIVFRFAPVRFEPAGFLHPMERGKKRARLYVEGLVRDLADPLRYTQAVQGTRSKRLQYEKVERALQKVRFPGFH